MALDEDSRRLMEEARLGAAAAPGMSPAALRAEALRLGRLLQGEPPEIARVHDEAIAGPGGALPVRVYDPQADEAAGCLVWLHGGGFTTGDLESHDALCRRLARLSGQVVVSVAYRLAPEHPYPAALHDSLRAVEWAAVQGGRLGVRSGRTAIGGSSAGGNLAAAAALWLRDRGGPALALQALVYPALDATMSLSRGSPHGSGYQLTSAMMAGYWANYAGAHVDLTDPYLSPLFARELSGLPPAVVVAAEFDPLAHEVERFAERLRRAGPLRELRRFPGVMHGFFAQAGRLAKAREAQEAVCAQVRSAVGGPRRSEERRSAE